MAPAWTPGYATTVSSSDRHDGGDDAAQRRAGNSAGGRMTRQRASITPSFRLAIRVQVPRNSAAFSLLATGLQFALDRAGLLSGAMASGSGVLAALLLIAAGIYQWTPLKQACLRHCRSPIDFLTQYWREGPFGPMRAARGTGRSASDAAGC